MNRPRGWYDHELNGRNVLFLLVGVVVGSEVGSVVLFGQPGPTVRLLTVALVTLCLVEILRSVLRYRASRPKRKLTHRN